MQDYEEPNENHTPFCYVQSTVDK